MSHVTTFVFLASSLLGQAKEEITKQQFIELGDSLVGQWVMKDRLVTDVDKIGKTGDMLTDNRTIEWVSNQTALLDQSLFVGDGCEPTLSGGRDSRFAPAMQARAVGMTTSDKFVEQRARRLR